MAKKYIINSTPNGLQDTEVPESALTNKQAKAVPYSRLVPFVLSALKGVVNRLQGLKVTTQLSIEVFFWVHFDRPWSDNGYKETLSQLREKGHTGFYCNGGREPTQEKGYETGQTWVTLGSMGTNDLNHNPGLTILWTLAQVEDFMYARIVPRPEVKYAIANHEYAWFVDTDPGNQNLSQPHYWHNVQNKNTPFVSALDGGTYTMQQLYDAAGGNVSVLLQHLHARRNQIGALWCEIWRAKNPGTFATNGDNCPFAAIPVNGDLGSYHLTNLNAIPYSVLRQYAGFGFGEVRGGQVNLNGRSYNLTGVECEYYDFFIQYYYPFEVFWKQSDMNNMLSSNDPEVNTIDYWHAHTWYNRHHLYASPIQQLVRQRLLVLHAQQGGKDMTGLKVADMNQHMYEGPQTFVCAENTSRTYPTVIGTGPSSFMKWVTTETQNQRLYLHKELIWARGFQARAMYWGMMTWWEVDAVDYSTGKWALFHQRSQETRQNVLDHIMVDADVWKNGSDKEVLVDGVQMRFRRNGGQWTDWFPSLSPMAARWGTSEYRPYIIRSGRPGKYCYDFVTGQEDYETTDVEWKHNNVSQGIVSLAGCMIQSRTIRENL